MSNQLRILGSGSRHSGVTYHRIALPLSTMEKQYALITDTPTEEMIKEKDINIFLVNRFCETESLIKILEWRQKYGFKLVVDIDDYWELFTQHLSYSNYRLNGIGKIIQSYIKHADLVTCTHSRLWAEIIKINKNCKVIPNALPFDKDQFTIVKIPHDKVTIAHTGSITHYPDIKQLKAPIYALSKDKRFVANTRMLLCGWNEFNKWHWDEMANIYTANERLEYKILKSLPVDLYMNHYAEADILVTPLLDNRFNKLKSNLKALEAGAKNIPIMTFNRDPYADIPTIFPVTNWEKDLRRMAESKDMREDYGLSNGEYVRKHYDLFRHNLARTAIYNKLLR
jgi:hypothetical protein